MPYPHFNIFSFSFILTNDGKVYVCGKNKSGILGLGDSRMKIKPTFSSYFGSIKIINIDFHENTAIALSHEGKVFCWGQNSVGVEKDLSYEFIDSNVPVQVDLLSNIKIVQIGISSNHFYAVSYDKYNLLTWGYTCLYYHKCSFRNVKMNRVKGLQLSNSRKIEKIACGTNHMIVLLTTGKCIGTLCILNDSCIVAFYSNE